MLDLRTLFRSIRSSSTSDKAAQVVASKLPQRVVFWTVAHALRHTGMDEFALGVLKPFLLRLSPESTPELDETENQPGFRVLVVKAGPPGDYEIEQLCETFPELSIERR